MPPCHACRHAQRNQIDLALEANEPTELIAERFGISQGSIQRHNRVHRLPATVGVDVHQLRPRAGSLMADLFKQAHAEQAKARKSGSMVDLNRANAKLAHAMALLRESKHYERAAYERGLADAQKGKDHRQFGRDQTVEPFKEITFKHIWVQEENKNAPSIWSKEHLSEMLKQFVKPELVRTEVEKQFYRLKWQTESEMAWFGSSEAVPETVQLACYFVLLWLESGTVPSELAQVVVEIIK